MKESEDSPFILGILQQDFWRRHKEQSTLKVSTWLSTRFGFRKGYKTHECPGGCRRAHAAVEELFQTRPSMRVEIQGHMF